CFVARRNGRSQFFMFVPDGQTLLCRLQYRPHDTPQVYPMNLRTLGDHGVARRFVNCFVKGFVGFDHGAYVMTTSNLAAQTDQVRVQYGTLTCRQLGCQRFQGTPHLVQMPDMFQIQRGHHDAPPFGVLQQPIFFQQLDGLQHGRAGHVELLGNVFLSDARAGGQGAVADGIEQDAIDLVNIVWTGLQLTGKLGMHEVWNSATNKKQVKAAAWLRPWVYIRAWSAWIARAQPWGPGLTSLVPRTGCLADRLPVSHLG